MSDLVDNILNDTLTHDVKLIAEFYMHLFILQEFMVFEQQKNNNGGGGGH